MAITIECKSPICLDEFRKWANFDPLTFNTITWDGCYNSPVHEPECMWWVQYPQHDRIMNRELLACRLCECAEEIRNYLETFVTPTWTNEIHQFPKFWMTEKNYIQPHFFETFEFKTNCWNVNQWGQPLYTLQETVNTVAIDANSDGLNEAYSITFQLPVGITLEQLKFYFPGNALASGLPDENFEICPVKSIDYNSISNDVTVIFDSWNLVRPNLYTIPTWQKPTPLNACQDIYTATIEVWSEVIDTCKPQIEVFWKATGCDDCGGSGCTRCDVISRFACARPTDNCEGIFNFSLIGEDASGCPDPTISCVDAPCRPPDYFKVYYNAGLQNKSVNRALFLLTSGKYQEVGQGCECDCVKNVLGVYSQQTIVRDAEERFQFTNIDRDFIWDNPFGTSVGAIESYRILREIKRNRCT